MFSYSHEGVFTEPRLGRSYRIAPSETLGDRGITLLSALNDFSLDAAIASRIGANRNQTGVFAANFQISEETQWQSQVAIAKTVELIW
ncbi:hypothetical protein H6G00_22750 [Leptolyngbya sp. FACHB-541]|uniref:hypothetical protein n=1 Tax=Leptolyngbya sp. FACHB-541 TaxID=2692810 RepID=UPI001683A888|nr:hypothetical protein [Leptolyngbya sp. FACHB-541]MBD1867870.1 hypothetical protein [Cyanobacteria bacterium FACHB-471]MBD1999395.1 hypothetical protein [Leptolyngbya sp. FACHB-541]